MAKYSIAFIIEKYFEFGGLQRDMRRFGRACAAAGHDVKVFTSDWDGADDDLLEVEILDFSGSANHRRVLSVQKFAQKLQSEKRFDCIVGFSRVKGLDVYFGGDPCYQAKIKRNGRWKYRFLPRYRTYLQLEQGVFGPCSDTDVMVISPKELADVKETYNIDPGRIHLIPPGIDKYRLTKYIMDDQQRSEFRKSYAGIDDGFVILTIGSSFDTKGIDRAIYAIAALPEKIKKVCHYIVIGKGDKDKYQGIADKAGIGRQITFTGGREDIGAFYYASDVLLHPARTETAGHTLLEAMICRLPVIVTEHCGYGRYVKEANGGVLCPDPFEQNQLNNILNDFLNDKAAREQLARNGYEYTQTADIYSMTDRVVEVILKRAERNRLAK
ncbi:MAG: glycosyltransferase family 4 protein [Phycisphaerae bacterium]|nr:glycosyltransferase family 4 protein [Phycisphaerae bacterium]